MAQGWISLDRQVRDNWIWKDKPYAKGQAWIDILLRVNHKANKVPIGNKIIDVEPGQTIWSIDDMANSWGWSRKKVSNFLNILQTESQIDQKRTSKYTLLTVVNWASYQNKEHQKNIKGTSREHQKNTNNNDNNDNNEIIKDIVNLRAIYKGTKTKSKAMKLLPKLLKLHGYEQMVRTVERYNAYVTKERKTFKDLKYLNESTFWNGRYEDYLDENYTETITKPNIIEKSTGVEYY